MATPFPLPCTGQPARADKPQDNQRGLVWRDVLKYCVKIRGRAKIFTE